MLDPKLASTTKVAVFASTQRQRQHLQSMLEKNGLTVVISEAKGDQFLSALAKNQVDVLLIDIGDEEDDELDFLDTINDKFDIPILFNDSGPEGVSLAASGDIWAKKLAEKLREMTNSEQNPKPETSNEAPFPVAKSSPKSINVTPIKQPQESVTPITAANKLAATLNVKSNTNAAAAGARQATGRASDLNVWVLGASLGGPQAVRQFLSAIEQDLPVVFILAQHIGANHVSLLAEQLNRVTKFTVVPGKTGYQLKHGEVILTPADKQLSLTDDGFIALQPAPPATIYSPSIDNVMSEVARCFGKRSGTIVFSGMGDDGARGCEAIAEHGGIVWAQDIASCVVSSMPDQARKTGKVSYSANPEQLAKHLYEYYSKSK